jgi:hypothetical protein
VAEHEPDVVEGRAVVGHAPKATSAGDATGPGPV